MSREIPSVYLVEVGYRRWLIASNRNGTGFLDQPFNMSLDELIRVGGNVVRQKTVQSQEWTVVPHICLHCLAVFIESGYE